MKKLVYFVASSLENTTHARNKVMEELYSKDVKIVRHIRLGFETKNVIVKFVSCNQNLNGINADEIFGIYSDTHYGVRMRKSHSAEPYKGTLVDYILEAEGK